MPDLANLDYVNRVNRAIDHILTHLDGVLRLEDVARIACFSPYHFHRIFHSLVGETLNVFIKRVRLERALYLMSHREGISLTEVALACGFSSSSDFSRSFRGHYGIAPRAFDLDTFRRSQRKALKIERLPVGDNPDKFTLEIRELPPRIVAYQRVHQSFEPDAVPRAAERMVAWASERGLAEGQWLGYMWDDPEIVALDKCRYDIGVEIPTVDAADSQVSVIEFPAMRVAAVEIAGTVELALRGIDWLYRTWLPRSGFAPDHQPGFEAFKGLPYAHGDTHFELTIHLAVVDGSTPA